MMRTALNILTALVLCSRIAHGQWRVDPKPLVDIGSADGADEYLFKRPSAARMRDGRIVVADPYTVDVRIFEVSRVKLPKRFTPHEIGMDYVLGVWLDEDEVPHVQMLRLIK